MFSVVDDWGRDFGHYRSLRQAMDSCKGKGNGQWQRQEVDNETVWTMIMNEESGSFLMIS